MTIKSARFKWISLIFSLFLCSLLSISINGELTEIIVTDKGPVQGKIRKTVLNLTFYSAFEGIPYAKPPIGNLRFKSPVEIEPWNDTFLATTDGHVCPQLNGDPKIYSGSEDCLNLNVYVPRIEPRTEMTNLLPVTVFIFGGAFSFGNASSSRQSPDYFLDENVIFVSMNYRLGALGLLALDHPDATGNAMIKDQQMALKWVNKNIIKFGGDPKKVTIFGRSSGSCCVDLHLLSEKSKGLFQQSISMSGTLFAPWGFSTPEEAKRRAFKLGELLGIKTNDKNELLKEMYKKPAEEIVQTTRYVSKEERVFKPTIENRATAGNDAFLSGCPVELFKTGQFLQLPHMTGFVANEVLVFATSTTRLLYYTQFALNSMDLVLNDELKHELSLFEEQLLNASNSNLPLSHFSDDFVVNGINLLSDVLTVNGMETKQRLMTQSSSTPVFSYRITFNDGAQSHHRVQFRINYDGVAHMDEFPYLFPVNTNLYKSVHLILNNERMYTYGKRLIKMWTNFVKYGNPTPNGTTDPLLNITWPASGKQGIHLEIGDNLSVIHKRPINETVNILQQAQRNGIIENQIGCI